MARVLINNLKPGDKFGDKKQFTMVDSKYIKSQNPDEVWAFYALDKRTWEVYGWATNCTVDITDALAAKRNK